MAAWYTTAWIDRYVKCQGDTTCEADADRRLLTNRWRDDGLEGEVDTNGDPNLYSFYLRSHYDFHRRERHRGHLRRHAHGLRVDGARRPAARLLTRGGRLRRPDEGAAGAIRRPARCRRPAAATDDETTLKGTAGGDALRGKRRRRRLSGGATATTASTATPVTDRLDGGAGEDKLRGGRRNDVLLANDGEADNVRCGRGRTTAPRSTATTPSRRLRARQERLTLRIPARRPSG